MCLIITIRAIHFLFLLLLIPGRSRVGLLPFGTHALRHFFLCACSLRGHKTKQVAALDFSSDGHLILAMAGGDGQALSVWDWRRGVRLATARAEAAFLPAHSVRFNPWLFLEGARAEAAGMAPGDACYTLVSCGQRHVRFWTLTRERLPYPVGEDDDGGEARRGWAWTLSSRRGSFDKRGDIDNMTCMAFIGEPLVGSRERGDDLARLPVARVVTGAENGQVGGGGCRGLLLGFWQVVGRPVRRGARGGGTRGIPCAFRCCPSLRRLCLRVRMRDSQPPKASTPTYILQRSHWPSTAPLVGTVIRRP